ncbi:MAG TPA: phenylalanine--tRNA ligase subunit beta [Solirubrobacteraceae bacterium]|jgi:phenylalanyl-tRNA synthetase beta chain|nr:phenylalanine--tRNA ligase subunit beta [Solirubrobacteraceae bacterium]
MRVPLPWLREYCDPSLDVAQIEERLTMTGTKVEAIHRVGVLSAENFVVGRVLTAEKHPDADRLKVCTVDVGEEQAATIVCGAPNVDAGQTVAVARPGAVMPDGTKLKQAKLRGVVSEGMILAASELDLEPSGERSAGIMVLDEMTLDAELAPGTPLGEVLPISTEVVELEITPNRPDCLGVYGVARELHAATGAALAPPPWDEDLSSGSGEPSGAKIRVDCPDLCPRFTARVFENVTIAPSPLWLKARLTAAGQRPINNVVDITNYAMLLTGQPLHAFDLDRVAGGELVVRRAHDGEQVQTLDGQTRTLDGEMVVIEDGEGPTSIAGVMGGARSEVVPDTTRVLMEVATWNGPNIHRTSWTLGLRSEASGRFEKGLQPEQCLHAQAVATALMTELCGATLVPGTIDIGGEGPPALKLGLRAARVEAILGLPVTVARQQEILGALDFDTAPAAEGLEVTVPALRRDDVTREIDLIEEVARIDGLERLPATLPARRGAAGRLSHAQRVRRAAEDAMIGRGLREIVGWSFAEPGLVDRLRLPAEHHLRHIITVENPLSEDQAMMRPTLLGSLLDAARHNVSRGAPDVSIFESGSVYRALDGDATATTTPADEHHALGALLCGGLTPRSWRGERTEADFFAAKALLAGMLDSFKLHWAVKAAEPERWPFLHPGRCAEVLARSGEGQPVTLGFLGEVHPLVAGEWDLSRTAAFAVDLGKLATVAPEVSAFKPFGAFPDLRQDIAVVLPESISAQEVGHLVRKAGGKVLGSAEIFDVYTGEQVGDGRRSLALALSFRSLEGTLTDEDVAPVREQIVSALKEIGGELRG